MHAQRKTKRKMETKCECITFISQFCIEIFSKSMKLHYNKENRVIKTIV